MTQIQRNSAVEYGNRELPEKLLCCPSSHGESKSILVDPQTPRRRGRGNADLILRAATQVASGRSLKRHSPKVRAEFTVPTELRKSFEFHRQLLIQRSRNCKFVRATSKSIRTVYPPSWKHEFRELRENPDNGSAYFDGLFKHLRMAFGLHW
jgi:hypothetical protein